MCEQDIIYPEEYKLGVIERILRAHLFGAVREPVMHRICCVCGVEYGTKPCKVEDDGMETHGYCPTCFDEVMREVEG